MSILTRVTEALRELEEELVQYPLSAGGADAHHIADRIREVRRMLSKEDAQWIGTTEAKRLLGVGSENTVKAWVRTGRLRSRVQPNGRVQVLLDDVLRRREETEGLSAFGGEDLTEHEPEELERSRPGMYPWEREQAARAG
ncbi:MAG: hypothetical protein HY332_13235 [Chloroflexi bacterium]|nr:hypothetical protein [Chloroflexota bacterium]